MGANEILQKLLYLANQVVPDEDASPALSVPAFRKPSRALIIPSQFIGDNVLLTPFIRNLRYNLGPKARIDVAATPISAPLYETLPGPSHVYIEKRGMLRQPRTFLQQQGYDTIILCRYSLAWATAALQAQVPQRVGFDLERLGIHGLRHWGKRLTHPIPSTPMTDPRPQVEIYLDMLRQLGLFVEDNFLECCLTELDKARARVLLERLPDNGPACKPRILVHTTSGSPGKNWPPHNWTHLLHMLDEQYAPVFVATGSLKERACYRAWEQVFPFLNLCGETTLRESIALMSQVDLVITLDTSVAHLAAIGGAPRLIVLYGPTNERQWRPQVQPGTFLAQVHHNLPCRPCPARTCESKSCIRQLTPKLVFQIAKQAFQDMPIK